MGAYTRRPKEDIPAMYAITHVRQEKMNANGGVQTLLIKKRIIL
jgi:hypothetical protein